MLIIRPEQMQAFMAPQRQRFEERMVMHVLGRFPCAAFMSKPEVHARVRRIISLAETHGIDCEADVQQFIELTFETWPEADRNPEILRILDSTFMEAPVKIALVADALPAGDK